MEVRSKIWIEKDGKLVFGEGKSNIFKAVRKYHSINKAAEDMGISYRHAWSYICEIEKRIGIKLVERVKGGRGGGGSELTPYAMELMDKYDRVKKDIVEYSNKKYEEIFK